MPIPDAVLPKEKEDLNFLDPWGRHVFEVCNRMMKAYLEKDWEAYEAAVWDYEDLSPIETSPETALPALGEE